MRFANIFIHPVKLEDAPSLLALKIQLANETKFMMLESGERPNNPEGERTRINDILESNNSMIFVAESEDKLIGHLSVYGDSFKRNKHNAYIVIGVLQEFTGQGIGKRLFEKMETWAREVGLHRLELTVMTHNEHAVKLYQRMGFEIEGTKRRSLMVDGVFVDEFNMAKLI